MNKIQTIIVATALALSSNLASADTISAPIVDTGAYRAHVDDNEMLYFGPPDFPSEGWTQHINLVGASTNPGGSHEGILMGNERFDITVGEVHQLFDISRRIYFAYDLSDITDTVTAAKLRIWGWAPNQDGIMQGVYRSLDPSETLTMFKIDNHTASEIIEAPFMDTDNHDLDFPIWQDLGDGTAYGSIDITNADTINPGLIPSSHPNANTTDCSGNVPLPADRACGRWIEIDLNAAALADINATTGDWITGGALTSIDYHPTEQLFAGSPSDFLHDGQFSHLTAPKAQLILTTDSVVTPVLGECDGSDGINIADVICIINEVLTPSNPPQGECDGVAGINISDVVCAINKVLE